MINVDYITDLINNGCTYTILFGVYNKGNRLEMKYINKEFIIIKNGE